MTFDATRRQFAIKIGTEGSYSSSVEDAAYATAELYDLKTDYDVQRFVPNPMRSTIGTPPSTTAARYGIITGKLAVKGSGSAGTAPALAPFLKIAGFEETTASGSEAFGSAVANPNNTGTSPSPVIGGSAVWDKSGVIELELVAKDNGAETATFNFALYPGDGTTPAYGDFSITDTSFSGVSLGNTSGATLDAAPTLTVDDPDGGGAGDPITSWAVGDRWIFSYTSADTVSNVYKTENTSFDVADVACYMDGHIEKFHSVRAKMLRFTAAGINEPVFLEFELIGVVSAQVDGSNLSGVAYETTVAPLFNGVTATLHSATPSCFNAFSVTIENNAFMRECATATGGYQSSQIRGKRKVTGTLNPIRVTKATKDYWSVMFNGTIGNYSLLVGSVAGNKLTIASSTVQIEKMRDGERAGDAVHEFDIRFAEPYYDAGSDYSELSITFD